MKTMQDLLEYLKYLNIKTKIYEHTPIFTAEAGRHLVEKIPEIHCKNLFLIDDQKNFWLVVVPFTTRIDLKQLAIILHTKKLQFGSVNDLKMYLGVTPGSVTPFGIINDESNKVRLILDNKLLEQEWINIHPLINTYTTSIQVTDLIKFIKSLEHNGLIINFDEIKIFNHI